jgi:hypothetical protein
MIPEYSAKLSPATKLRLSEVSNEQNPVLNVLVRTDGSLDPGQRSQLEGTGATVRTVAGDVTTVVIPFDGLPQLVSLDFVNYVEISRPLYPELQAGESSGAAREATLMVARHSERPVLPVPPVPSEVEGSEVEGSEEATAERSEESSVERREESAECDEGLCCPYDYDGGDPSLRSG